MAEERTTTTALIRTCPQYTHQRVQDRVNEVIQRESCSQARSHSQRNAKYNEPVHAPKLLAYDYVESKVSKGIIKKKAVAYQVLSEEQIEENELNETPKPELEDINQAGYQQIVKNRQEFAQEQVYGSNVQVREESKQAIEVTKEEGNCKFCNCNSNTKKEENVASNSKFDAHFRDTMLSDIKIVAEVAEENVEDITEVTEQLKPKLIESHAVKDITPPKATPKASTKSTARHSRQNSTTSSKVTKSHRMNVSVADRNKQMQKSKDRCPSPSKRALHKKFDIIATKEAFIMGEYDIETPEKEEDLVQEEKPRLVQTIVLQDINQKEEKVKGRLSDQVKALLLENFMACLRDIRSMEQKRVHLALRYDFCLTEIFHQLDRRQTGYVNLLDIWSWSQESQISMNKEDWARIIDRFDNDMEGYLCYTEFIEIFAPGAKQYRKAMLNRAHTGIKKFADLTIQTKKLCRDLLYSMVTTLENFEANKYRISGGLVSISSDCFDFFDLNKDGLITFTEFYDKLQREKVTYTKTEIRHLFLEFDKNKSGKISFNEFFTRVKDSYCNCCGYTICCSGAY